MGTKVKTQSKHSVKKRSSVAMAAKSSADVGNRVTALESAGQAQHEEIMRMLNDMRDAMKDGLKDLTDEVKGLIVTQVEQDGKIEASRKDITRIDSRINKVMGGIGTLAIAIISGVFAVFARYLGGQ